MYTEQDLLDIVTLYHKVDISNLEFESEKLQGDLVSVLNFLDKKHSIIINEEIGLLVNYEFIVDENVTDILSYPNRLDLYKRGDYFNVIDKDGCLLFKEDIIKTCCLKLDNKTFGYVFILKNFLAKDEEESFFDDEATVPALIAYIDNKLYRNNIIEYTDCNVELDKSIKYKEMSGSSFIIHIHNKAFTVTCADRKNNIYTGKLLKMNL